MPEMTPGAALRQLQQTQAGLKKARQLLRLSKGDPEAASRVLAAGWEKLAQTHRVLASLPFEAVDDAVLTRQLAVQRYATALLVRLRRVLRKEDAGDDDADLGVDEE